MFCKLAEEEPNSNWKCTIRNDDCLFSKPDIDRCNSMYGISNNSPIKLMDNVIDEIIDEEGYYESEEDEVDNLID